MIYDDIIIYSIIYHITYISYIIYHISYAATSLTIYILVLVMILGFKHILQLLLWLYFSGPEYSDHNLFFRNIGKKQYIPVAIPADL